METFCFCTAGDVHGDDYDENYDDLNDGDVVDNDDVVVDNVEQERDIARVERERDLARAKREDVLSAVAHGQRKNKPNEWMNAVLYKLSLIGVTYTTILQRRLPTLNQRLQSMDMPAFHKTILTGISSEVSK